MSRASRRKMQRRRAHGPQQAQRKADALVEARMTARKQRKGAKGVETAMARLGYRGELVARRVKRPGRPVVIVKFQVWRRLPKEAA